MSTPTLQQVLLTVPGFGAQINSFNEIIPGVPSTAENLATMFAAFEQQPYIEVNKTPDIFIYIRKTNADDDDDYDEDLGPLIRAVLRVRAVPGMPLAQVGPVHRFLFDANGLYMAILWAKEAAHIVARDGVCVCRAAPVSLNFKLDKMPLCLNCLVARPLHGQAA